MAFSDLAPSLAVGCFGVFFVAIGLWARRLNERAAGWPSAIGEIVESTLDRTTLEPGWSARVRYRYAVQGRVHESRQISFKVRSATAPEERKLVERYPVGLKVQVFYDPDDPDVAVIDAGSSSGWWWFVGFGTLCLAAAVWIPFIPVGPGPG